MQISGSASTRTLPANQSAVSSHMGSVAVLIGEGRHFQIWYRDEIRSPTFNLTGNRVIDFQ